MELKEIQKLFFQGVSNNKKKIGNLKNKFNSSKIRFLMINDFLPLNLALHLESKFPEPNFKSDLKSRRYQIGKHIISKDSGNLDLLDESLIKILECFKSSDFINFIKLITNINDLECDPDDWGAGIQQTEKGGFLKRHIDSPYKENKKNLYRRINTILYLNSNWKSEYYGDLEIWEDEKIEKPLFKITPILNRLIIFETSSFSWHGYSKPLNCPKNTTRKSIAQFFYSKNNGLQNINQNNPLWYEK
tara:strand:- start:14278 stop:15015 length:738 start_codon:yes stop_codon:yes gene_type:complete